MQAEAPYIADLINVVTQTDTPMQQHLNEMQNKVE
jgi:hypothetical protein